MSARWIPKCASPNPAPVRSAVWRSSRKHLPRRQRAPNTLPVHPEIVRPEPAPARSADGSGTADGYFGGCAESRVGRHDPAVLDQRGTFPAAFILAMSDMLPGQPLQHIASPRILTWIQFVLATPVVLWGGWPFVERGWQSIVNRSLNMFTLIAIGVGAAYLYSVAATVFPDIFPPSFYGHSGTVSVYFEAAAIITTLVLLGQVLELRARSKTSRAIKALLGLSPKTPD